MIDVDQLLQPVSDDAPCGEDLEYDEEFGELERCAQSRSEQQIGDTIVPAEEPDWREVGKRANALFSRTKDLRVAMYLLRAQVRTDGFAGLHGALGVLRGLIEQFWEPVHPRLDPDDDNDPTMRVNVIASMCDADTVLKAVREAPLVSSRTIGRFSLRDIKVATGELSTAGDDEKAPDTTTIDAAFADVAADELQAMAARLSACMQSVSAIESVLTDKVGTSKAADFSSLFGLLRECSGAVGERLSQRGLGASVAGAGELADPEIRGDGPATGGAAPVARVAGEITSREDVVKVLGKVCEWYARAEPSSPVPILLKRASRLVNKGFLELVQDLAPDGVSQVERIRGDLSE